MSFLPASLLSIARNTAGTVFLRGAFGIARIGMLLLIAGKFGPVEFGKLALVISILEICKVIADMGLDIVSIRRFASGKDTVEGLTNNILSTKLVSASLLCLFTPLLFLLAYGRGAGEDLLFVLLPSVFTGILVNVFTSYFQSQLAVKEALPSHLLGVGWYLLSTIGGLLLDLPLLFIAAMIPLSELLTLGFLIGRYRRRHPVTLQLNISFIRELLSESVFVGISGALVVIYLRTDNLLLSHFLGSGAVGEYSVAYRLTEPFFLLFSSLSISLYASLSGRWGTPAAGDIRPTIRRILFLTTGIALGGILIIVFGVRPLLGFFPVEYAQTADVLLVLSFSLLFKGINPQLTAILNSLGKFRMLTMVTVFNVVGCFVLNIVLIPRYGVFGAAAALVVCELLNTSLQAIIVVTQVKHQFASQR